MIENRKSIKRWDLLLFLPVKNADTGELFGNIADITMSGILVFCQEALTVGSRYHLEIELEELKNSLLEKGITPDKVSFDAIVRWQDSRTGLHRTGLMFDSLSAETHQLIKQIVRNAARNFPPLPTEA